MNSEPCTLSVHKPTGYQLWPPKSHHSISNCLHTGPVGPEMDGSLQHAWLAPLHLTFYWTLVGHQACTCHVFPGLLMEPEEIPWANLPKGCSQNWKKIMWLGVKEEEDESGREKVASASHITKNLLKWVFMCLLFLAAQCLHCCMRAFSSCSEQGLLFIAVWGFSLRWLLFLWGTGLRHTGFSNCGLWVLQHRLSSCGAWA